MDSDPGVGHDPSHDGRYRGLLVDYGGVLTSDLFESFRSFCRLEGLEPDAVLRRFREDRRCRALLIDLETGRLAEEDFEPRFAGVLGVDAPELIDRLFAGSRPDEAMLSAVRRARQAGIRTGLISNSWGTRRYDRTQLSALFDGVVISGEVGMRKPAPEIYALGAERIGLPAAQCVFVDDLPFNLDPAQQLGMATVHHTGATETIGELERLLDVELR
ncbi:MAG TPA: HAD family phosphatase [Solirubrobacteraceae bacterium]|jgi:epoxide hydrolase-like predicted phosphatase|nr:HAD family phosphatase [Solirubrobacteraceae bacterium]